MQVKTVAAGLYIHPFALSRWRKEVCDGVLRGPLPRRAPAGPTREPTQLQGLERQHPLLQEEQDLPEGTPSGSVPLEDGHVRLLHRHPNRNYGVSRLCRRHGVTRAGYYA